MIAGTLFAGAGYAAGECAMKLRQAGYPHPVTLIGTEPHLPYQRRHFPNPIWPAPPRPTPCCYGRRPPTPRRPSTSSAPPRWTKSTVDEIDRAARTIRLSTGASMPYAHLVLSTGGHARRLTCPGAGLDGVLALRTLDDVAAIRAHLRPARRVVIIGGGYIGLEVAAMAVKHGVAVTIVEAAPRVLARVAGAEISAFYERFHRGAGVTIITGSVVAALTEDPAATRHVGGVALADGRHLQADFVLAGIGPVPNDHLARQAGLHAENGIWVDEYCRTEDRAILAIGDCANHPSAFLGRRVRLE